MLYFFIYLLLSFSAFLKYKKENMPKQRTLTFLSHQSNILALISKFLQFDRNYAVLQIFANVDKLARTDIEYLFYFDSLFFHA